MKFVRIYNSHYRDVSRAVALQVCFRRLVEMGEVTVWSHIGHGLARYFGCSLLISETDFS